MILLLGLWGELMKIQTNQVWKNKITGEELRIRSIKKVCGITFISDSYLNQYKHYKKHVIRFYTPIHPNVLAIRKLGKCSTGVTGWKKYTKKFKHGVLEIEVNKVKGEKMLMFDATFKGVLVDNKMIKFDRTIIEIPLINIESPYLDGWSPGTEKYKTITIKKTKLAHSIRYEIPFLVDIPSSMTRMFNKVHRDFDRLITEEYGKNSEKEINCPRCFCKQHTLINAYRGGKTVECLRCGEMFEVEDEI